MLKVYENELVGLMSENIIKDMRLDENRGLRQMFREMFEGFDYCLEVWDDIEL